MNWSSDTRLSTLPANSLFPSVTSSGSFVHLVWSGSPGFEASEIYYKRSATGGLSWEPDFRLTLDSVPSGFPSACISNQSVHVLWLGELEFGNNLEIFYKRNPLGNTSGIQVVSGEIPRSFRLGQNYPNPFNPSTKIGFELPEGAVVRLTVYDITGREIQTLVNSTLRAGVYEYEWSGINLPSGVYFYRLVAGNYSQTKKMLLVK